MPTGHPGNGRSGDAPEVGTGGTAVARAGDLRVQPSSPARRHAYPDPIAPGRAHGRAGRPDRTGAAAGPWPALPAPAGENAGGTARDGRAGAPPRDPWPALPDDQELWAPVAGTPAADRLARLDREQAGD
ncbi:hypothetical protein ACFFMM_25430 [Micromonospora chaiyaphumensis]